MASKISNSPTKDEAFNSAWRLSKSHTKASMEKSYALWTSVEHILSQNIPGCFVECGSERSCSAILIILAMMRFGTINREIFVFDRFAGTLPLYQHDKDPNLHIDTTRVQNDSGTTRADLAQEVSSYTAVRQAIAATGVDMRLVRMIDGDAKETIRQTQTMAIALLRLDIGSHDSRVAELEELYPRVSKGGILFMDNHGHCHGSQEAIETYFKQNKFSYSRPMLWAIDTNSRVGVKSESPSEVEIARYDFYPCGMQAPDLLPYFPHVVPTNPWSVTWPYLRKHIPHIWRTDRRNRGYTTGYASIEECIVLYTIATQFKGRRGLEIGSHYGWTAAHLLAAGLVLDCVDPAFQDPDHASNVAETFDAMKSEISDSGEFRLWGGYSPLILKEVAASGDGRDYSFVFIDGNHDGDAPAADTQGVLPYLDDDAIVMLHDLSSPHVAGALPVLAQAGFQIRLINTMQIMAVAWRGQVHIPSHVQDPNCGAIFIEHLTPYIKKD